MNLLFEILGGVWLAYAAVILWLVYGRGAFSVVYNPMIAPLIRGAGMQAMTVGARCYLAHADARLTPSGLVHETFHYREQWRRRPLTFLPRYFFQLARYGYDKCPMENEARVAAGEPAR